MEKNRSTKFIALAALVVAVIGTSIAFAAMSTTLTINGAATMKQASWNVHFANLVVGTPVGSATNVGTPVIADDTTTISGIDVTLTKPGDQVTYTFDVVNAGSLDAVLSDLQVLAPSFSGAPSDVELVRNSLKYTLTYTGTTTDVANGNTLSNKDADPAEHTKNLTLTITYDPDATALPTADVTITGLGYTLQYSQA